MFFESIMKKNNLALVSLEIEKNINKYIANEDNPEYLRNIARELKILPLFLDMGRCFGIGVDGKVIAFHFDGEFEPYVEKDLRNINIALYQGSKLYPELKELLSSKPKAAKICHVCNGTGLELEELRSKSPLVCYCGGLGWLPKHGVVHSPRSRKYRDAKRLDQEFLALLENSKNQLGQSRYNDMKHSFELYEELKSRIQNIVMSQEAHQALAETLGIG